MQRDFLSDCDKLLTLICSKGLNHGTGTDELQELAQSCKSNLNEMLIYMGKGKRGHIKVYAGNRTSPTAEGMEFSRTTSYVNEFDKEHHIEQGKWYDTENARLAYEGYPFTRRLAWAAIIIAALSAIITGLQLLKK